MKISRQVFYSGRVQGVGFRYSVKQLATGFEVTGWARNLPDGTVEMQAAGDREEVNAFVAAIAASHLAGYIKNVRQHEVETTDPATAGFEVRH